jgi:hypothetical protein
MVSEAMATSRAASRIVPVTPVRGSACWRKKYAAAAPKR